VFDTSPNSNKYRQTNPHNTITTLKIPINVADHSERIIASNEPIELWNVKAMTIIIKRSVIPRFTVTHPVYLYHGDKIYKQLYAIYYNNKSASNIDYFHRFRIKSAAKH